MILRDLDAELLIRLVIAMVFGGIVGFERGSKNHDAGLRTHMIVCIGAAAIMVMSESLARFYNIPQEIMRMGAQVVSGIVFLGVGSIIFDGNKVRGVTTAAGLWTTAGIGLAVGCGCYLVALVVAVLILITNTIIRPLVVNLRTEMFHVSVQIGEKEDTNGLLKEIIHQNVEINEIRIEKSPQTGITILDMSLKATKGYTIENLLMHLSKDSSVLEFNKIS
jgi:putative Mg2+ transporter-C (MgtC) family protein